MPNVILYVREPGTRRGCYLEYSTVVDAPTTRGMKRAEMLRYLVENHGRADLDHHKSRLARAYVNGSSYKLHAETAPEVLRSNRAGPRDLRLSLAGIVQCYCKEEWRPTPGLDAALCALREWLQSPANKVDDMEPAILERVTPLSPSAARVDLVRNSTKGGPTASIVLTPTVTPETVRAACDRARDVLYGRHVRTDLAVAS